MQARVFIDGQAGTTGLSIRERLLAHPNVELLEIDAGARKDTGARRDLLHAADVAILCLPDDAARDAVALADGKTRMLDASTAHRVAEGWVYGLPELAAERRDAIGSAQFVSNPGCYPTLTTLLLRPLIDAGHVAADAAITVHALSGYSGGGRKKIEHWEDPARGLLGLPYEAPYALGAVHKHIPEMTHQAGLAHAPQFIPAIGPFRCGMRVEIPLHAATIGVSPDTIHATLAARFDNEPFVRVQALGADDTDERHLDPTALNGTNSVDLHVVPHASGHVLLVGITDNLGKGAGGAAVQNLNLMLGVDETLGLPA